MRVVLNSFKQSALLKIYNFSENNWNLKIILVTVKEIIGHPICLYLTATEDKNHT